MVLAGALGATLWREEKLLDGAKHGRSGPSLAG